MLFVSISNCVACFPQTKTPYLATAARTLEIINVPDSGARLRQMVAECVTSNMWSGF